MEIRSCDEVSGRVIVNVTILDSIDDVAGAWCRHGFNDSITMNVLFHLVIHVIEFRRRSMPIIHANPQHAETQVDQFI